MSATKDVFKKYVKNIFIETGSYRGDGVGNALAVGFKRAYSIELSPELWAYCVNLYEHNPNAVFLRGYSPDYLKVLMGNIHEPVTIWLDAHYSGGDTAKGVETSPVMKELEVIRSHPVKTHTIMIDDIGDWEKYGYGITVESAKEFIRTINKDYRFILEEGVVSNDILVAVI